MKRLTTLLILLFSIIIIIPGIALAETWPGSNWVGGGDGNISFNLQPSLNHAGPATRNTIFAVYTNGDTRNETPTIRFNNKKCDLADYGTGKTQLQIDVGGDEKIFGACPPANFDIALKNGSLTTILKDGVCVSKTKYTIKVKILNPHWNKNQNNIFKFDVTGNASTTFGLLASPDNYGLQFTLGGVDQYDSRNVKIPVATSREGGQDGIFTLFDSDNNINSNVQNDKNGNYHPLKLYLRNINSGDNKIGNPYNPGSGNSWSGGKSTGYVYEPVNPGSSVDMRIGYTIFKNNNYNFVLQHLGGDNYVALGVPFNEYQEGCPLPPPPTQPMITPHTTGVSDFEKGSGDITGIKHYITVTPGCNTSATTAISYVTGGDGNPTSSAGSTTINNNCGTAYNINLPDGTISATLLNGKNPGDKFSRYTQVILPIPKIDTAIGTVHEVPYARFYGSDIYAENAPYFNSKGSGPAFNSIFNTGVGSVAQFAVMALNAGSLTNDINLPSAGFRTIQPARPDGLKAKVSPLSTPSLTCSPSSSITLNLLSNSGCYEVGNNDLNLSGANYGQKQITIVSNGTVIINGDIINNGPEKDNVPVLVIKAKNINIVGSVNRIDAILIATDTINTCSNISSTNGRSTVCRNTLTVNGALSANEIKFQRSVGTRLLGADSDNAGYAGKQNIFSRTTDTSATAAEIVNFPAYLYFATPADGSHSQNDLGVRSYLNAPPRL